MSKGWTARLKCSNRCWNIWLGRRRCDILYCCKVRPLLKLLTFRRRYRCKELGFEFENDDGSFSTYHYLRCQADRTWKFGRGLDTLPPCTREFKVENFSSSQWSTVSMLRSHLQRQIWLWETTTHWVPGVVVVISTTHVAQEAITNLPLTSVRGATHWHAMMTITMKLQTGQLVSQVSVVVAFWNIMCIFSNILPRTRISWDRRNQISPLF